MIRKFIYVLLISMLICMTACSKQSVSTINNDSENSKLTIAVSIIPEETFVKAVGGDLVQVVTMIPPGNSPANYQPTPVIMEKFNNAKAYFTIGVPTEEANILPKAKEMSSSMKIVSLQEKVENIYETREFTQGQKDPHIWLSPKRVIVMINAIKDTLCELDSEHKYIYDKNAEAYIEKLNKLDVSIKQKLNDSESKDFIVYHPSFGYFADDYGLHMITLEKNGKKAAPKDIEKVIDLAAEKNIKVIFYQAEIDSSQAKTIAEEINGRVEKVSPLASNYIENLEKIAEVFKESMDN